MTKAHGVKILIVEDHHIVRLGLRLLLNELPGFQVVAEAGNGLEAVQQCLQHNPDVVLMDIGLPGIDGIEAARQMKASLPQVRIIMLASFDNDEAIFASLGAGVDGFCGKDIPTPQLASAIDAVIKGSTWLDPRIAKRAAHSGMLDGNEESHCRFILTQEHQQLLALIERGLDNNQIADEMALSIVQVRSKMREIVEMLLISDKAQECLQALRQLSTQLNNGATRTLPTLSLATGSPFPNGEPTLPKNSVFLEKYLIRKLIDKTPSMVVYQAENRLNGTTLSIKLLTHLRYASEKRHQLSPSFPSHPNIATIYEMGVTDRGVPFLITDFTEGQPLSVILRKQRRLSLSQFFEICDQVCQALIEAHACYFIHCYLRPDNIVLCPHDANKPMVKVLDFGLSSALPQPLSPDKSATSCPEAVPSPTYMSPEQCQSQRLDCRTDLYSLGCIMYEALTGYKAFEGITPFDILSKHLQEQPRPFAVVCPERTLPAQLQDVVFKAMAKSADNRFSNASELRAALLAVQSHCRSRLD